MEKFNGNRDLDTIITKKPRVLVAPLDWGLGHATRCIPVIYELIRQNAEIWLAGEGKQEAILREEFPDLPFLQLPGYRVSYGDSARGLLRNILIQTPAILKAIKRENNWLRNAVSEYRFDAVIADNRYGLYHEKIPCVFITHQLKIKTPFGKWAEGVLQKWNYRFINRFSECWVVDNEKHTISAGELSHPSIFLGIPVHYVGLLSRLRKINVAGKKDHLFISLSGPEPQRTLLENKIVYDISRYPGTAVIVRGLPDTATIIPSTNDIRFYNHLPASGYNREMEQAEFVISRSGYSTIMDIIRLDKKSILIPTPGQTEQEYLAKYLFEKQKAFCISQKRFLLSEVLERAKQFNYNIENNSQGNELSLAVNSLLGKLK